MSTFSSSNFNSVFTTLSTALKTELDLQFTNRRIIGSEYANAYTQLMDTVLKLAYGDQLTQAQIAQSEAQVDSISREIIIKETQSAKDLLVKQSGIDFQSEQKNDLAEKRQSYIDLVDAQKTSQEADASVKSAQAADISSKTQPSISLMAAQEEVYLRQKTGFDDNAKQKMLEVQLNAWGLMFSSGMLETSPGIITNDSVSTLYANMKTNLGM